MNSGAARQCEHLDVSKTMETGPEIPTLHQSSTYQTSLSCGTYPDRPPKNLVDTVLTYQRRGWTERWDKILYYEMVDSAISLLLQYRQGQYQRGATGSGV